MIFSSTNKLKTSHSKGASVVEFVILIPLLLVFIAGIVEFGFLWMESNHIANAVREGARVAARTAEDQRSDAALNAVRDYLVTFPPFADKIDDVGFLDLSYTESPLVGADGTAIDGVDQVTIVITVDTSKVWNPVLWQILKLLPFFPGTNYPNDYLTSITQTASFAVQD